MTSPVVVTGLGVLSPYGAGWAALWDGIRSGATALRPCGFPGDASGVLAGRVPTPVRRDVVRTPAGRRIDRLSLLLLSAARLALRDAGLPAEQIAGDRTAIVLGSGFGNFEETAGFLDRLFDRGTANPLVFPNLVMNAPLSYASIELGVTGPTVMVTEQEVSSEVALAVGADLVARGVVDRCLAGAGDELTAELVEVLWEVGVLAPDAPRPYDRGACGFAPGEAATVLVLEGEERAQARAHRPRARLAGVTEFSLEASAHDWPRSAEPLAQRITPVVRRSDLLIGGACGIPRLDRLEAAALVRAADGDTPPVTAPCGALGHSNAAGGLAVAVAILALETGVVPPTLGCREPVERALTLPATARDLSRIDRAAVIGLARGGACTVVELERSVA